MYNVTLACEQCWVSTMLIAHIPLIFKFQKFNSYNNASLTL